MVTPYEQKVASSRKGLTKKTADSIRVFVGIRARNLTVVLLSVNFSKNLNTRINLE